MGRQFATGLLAVGLVLLAFPVARPLTAAVEGVEGVKIDAEEGTATIVVEKGATVSVQDIKEAVAKADKGHQHGFNVIEIKEVEKEAE